MNRIAEEILSYYGISELSENDILRHYGMPRRSGRYPWGSGENPYQHSADFLARVEELQKQGKSEKEIADEIGLTTTELREMSAEDWKYQPPKPSKKKATASTKSPAEWAETKVPCVPSSTNIPRRE